MECDSHLSPCSDFASSIPVVYDKDQARSRRALPFCRTGPCRGGKRMWTRRQLGAAALGAGMGPAAAPAATDARFALAPDVAARWAKHQSESAPRLVQLPDGVRLRAGPMGAPDRNGLAI